MGIITSTNARMLPNPTCNIHKKTQGNGYSWIRATKNYFEICTTK